MLHRIILGTLTLVVAASAVARDTVETWRSDLETGCRSVQRLDSWRAGSFDHLVIGHGLEDREVGLLEDEQIWRGFDHQCMQTAFAVCKSPAEIQSDKVKCEFFRILDKLSGDAAFRDDEQWFAVRKKAGKPPALESMPGEAAAPGVGISRRCVLAGTDEEGTA